MRRCGAGMSSCAASKPTVREKSVRGDLARLLGREVAVHHGTATRRKRGAMLVHAGGDLRNVRDLTAAEAERVARALLLGFRTVGKRLGRGHRGKRGSDGQSQNGLAKRLGVSGGHGRLLLGPSMGPVDCWCHSAPTAFPTP